MATSWESHKDVLHTLYVTRNKTLKSIMVHMKEVHGFEMKCECLSRSQTSTESLISLQERSIRAAVQEMELSQEQHS